MGKYNGYEIPGLFITGTDTGVGKTHVSCLLASVLRERLRVGVMKPAESGCSEEDGRLLPSDALRLCAAAACSHIPLEQICPYPFARPLAPAEAARQAEITVDVNRIKEACAVIARSSQAVLVEGAGGLLVPLSGRYLFADLARDLGWPLLIVARAGLGTVNHTLLTLDAARQRGLFVAGVVLNENVPVPRDDPSAESNPRLLRELAGPVPVWGPIPHRPPEEPVHAHGADAAPMPSFVRELIEDVIEKALFR